MGNIVHDYIVSSPQTQSLVHFDHLLIHDGEIYIGQVP